MDNEKKQVPETKTAKGLRVAGHIFMLSFIAMIMLAYTIPEYLLMWFDW